MNRVFLEILKQYWGYDSFRSLQEEIINSVYERNDTLGLMPTGDGKSLTFQIPTLLMNGICVVITPLISLMEDQVDTLRKKGIKATMVHSGMSRFEIITALENCIFGDYKFIYISPERLSSDLFVSRLKDMNVCLIVVDESHCISQWGYDFRPAYLQIASLRDLLPDVPILALTATATPVVVDDIQDKLLFRKKNVFQKSFERKNIAYIIRKTDDKLFEILKILRNVPGSGIIYVRSRNRTKIIATELQRHGVKADFFHANLTLDEKMSRQSNWKSGQCRILVCTSAFGMGIDKPDVRTVIHFELPSSIEEYFQEAGRAGRDGIKSYAVALYSPYDEMHLKERIKDEFPEKDFIKDVYEKLAYFFEIGMGMGVGTGHNFIIERFCTAYHYNMKHVYSALKILDLAGYIKYVEETDKQSKLRFTVLRDELYHINDLDSESERLLQVLLRSYTGLFTDYIYINEILLSQRTGLSPQIIYEGLKMLSAEHIVQYVPARRVPTIYYLRARNELKHIQLPRAIYEERRDRLTERVKNIIYYGSSMKKCRSQLLLNYFGEKEVSQCGQCDVCLAERRKEKQKQIVLDPG